jgi:exodeoxyribonuclease V alpha subunit
MHEATGRSASTIASFLKAGKELTDVSVVVLDESSMIDLVTMYRLLELLPNKVRILLAGDPEQLMPVGPGLVMHALIKVDFIPLEELRIVKRFGGDIALAASSIRNGIWPSLTQDSDHSISFVKCANSVNETGNNEISQKVLDLFQVDPINTQILCARRGGPDGVKVINSICQSALTSANQPVMVRSFQHDAMILTGFHVGDTVLCTRNMWDRGLQNGSLGKIVEIEKSTSILTDDGKEADVNLAWVLWDDGERRPITESMLDNLELGFAITVHKAQGSQWDRIIVPVTGHRLLDRTMIYTAITRAQKQVVIVGDEAAARAAVEGQPRVRLRQVALDLHLLNLAPVE